MSCDLQYHFDIYRAGGRHSNMLPHATASYKILRPASRSFSSTLAFGSASHAYHIPHVPTAGPSRPPPPPAPTRATTERPILTPEEQQVIDRIVRVDQAGELGANWIYRGQKLGMGIRGDRKAVKQIDVSFRKAIDFR